MFLTDLKKDPIFPHFSIIRVFLVLTILILGLFLGVKVDAATKTVCGSGCDYATIAAAESGATAGDIINVETGVYNEINPTFTKGLTWVAIDGDGTVTISNSGGGSYAATVTGNSNSLNIRGFIFDGLNTKSSVLNLSNGASNKIFQYCTFRNATGQDLNYGTGMSFITFDHSTIYEPSNGSKPLAFNGTLTGEFKNGTIDYYGNAWFGLLSSNSEFDFTNNTVDIRGMSSVSASIWDMNGTSINFATTGNTENIVSSGNYYIRGDRANTGGSISFNNNTTINFWGMAFIRLTTAGAWNFNFQGSVIGSGTTITKPCLELINQASMSLTNFTIDMSAVNAANTSAVPISITSTGINGSISISNFTIKSNVKAGYYIQIGTEATGVGDNRLDGSLITNGTIYGYRYYNPSATDGTAHGIFIGHNINASISRIKHYGNPYCVVLKGSPMTYSAGGYFSNLCVDAIGSGSSAVLAKGIANANFYNNTILNTGSDVMRGFSAYENGSGQEASGSQFKNNIIFGNIDYMVLLDGGAQTNFLATNNDYYTTGNLRFSVDLADKTLAEWKAFGSNYDSVGSLSQNPLFISSSDFHLQSASPAINGGVDVGLTVDLDGNAVPSGLLPDIGAYEFQDSTAPTTVTSKDAGVYSSTQSITLICDDSSGVGCDKIYYTTNGDTPTISSTQYSQPILISQTTTLKFFSQDLNGNLENVQTKVYTIDGSGPSLSFTDDVESGPAPLDTVTANWGDATIMKWSYDSDGVCSQTVGVYTKTNADSMNQNTEINNGKYICLYAEDVYGNKTTLASANDINIREGITGSGNYVDKGMAKSDSELENKKVIVLTQILELCKKLFTLLIELKRITGR